MIDPQKVITPPGFAPEGYGKDKMGMYRFKDGVVYLVRLHESSGEWQTMQYATPDQNKLLQTYERKLQK